MDVDSTVRRIKSLKIQGATNVAVAALKAYSQAKNKAAAKRKLLASRPTEPMLRNVLKLSEQGFRASEIIQELAIDRERIVKFGVRKLARKNSVYTHCHSSTVTEIIKAVRPKMVYNTETRPLYQGRITARELANAGINVTYFVDAAMRLAIKKADVILLGCDAITAEGKVVNKIGSELVAETAGRYKTPVYICTHSLKYDPHTEFGFDTVIEKRVASEVWTGHPKGVKISNLAFEFINPDLITAIISEMGVLTPENFIEAFNKKWPQLYG